MLTVMRGELALIRHDYLDGVECYVLPCVMITEGVHVGSGGAIYYSKEELGRSVESWGHKPVVVYHPEMNGKAITACSKDVIDSQRVGVILNVRMDGNKLKCELWLDKGKVNKVDSRIEEMMYNGDIIEVSTGLYTKDIDGEGLWGEEVYDKKATDIKGDHLAILPDQEGACSVADGAGFPRVNKRNERVIKMERKEKIDALISNDASKWEEGDVEFLLSLDDEKFDKVDVVKVDVVNEVVKEVEVPVVNEVAIEDVIANTQGAYAEYVRGLIANDRAEHEALVNELLSDKRCTFNKARLDEFSKDELKSLKDILSVAPNYSGQMTTAPAPVANSVVGGGLPLPVVFEEAKN